MADPGSDLSGPIRIGRWFQGPTGAGQGGWTAHRLVQRIDRPVTVALRAAVPLDADLEVVQVGDDTTGRRWDLIGADGTTIMSATAWEPAFADTAAVAVDDAVEARRQFDALVTRHPVPHCFSCGRQPDSMRVHAGPLGDGRFATDWTVPDWAVGSNSVVDAGALWAAIDCCAAWWVGYSSDRRTALTVQYAAEVRHRLEPGATYSLVGWAGDHGTEWDGRKRHAASAAFAADGTCVARSVSYWVAITGS